jgi:hypothetical protein
MIIAQPLTGSHRADYNLLFAGYPVDDGGRLAQLVEHRLYTPAVTGSSPVSPTTYTGGDWRLADRMVTNPITQSEIANLKAASPLRGVVVQLVRTLPCHGRGRGFESRPPRHSLGFQPRSCRGGRSRSFGARKRAPESASPWINQRNAARCGRQCKSRPLRHSFAHGEPLPRRMSSVNDQPAAGWMIANQRTLIRASRSWLILTT